MIKSEHDTWNNKKKNLDNKTAQNIFCKTGDIWWCSIGKNIGTEQNGNGHNYSRPVLILKVFNKNMFFGIPITSSDLKNTKKRLIKYYSPIKINNSNSFVILTQLRLFDTKRLLRKISKVDKDSLKDISDSLFDVI